MTAPVLSTERLMLRPLAAADFAPFRALHAAPHAVWMWVPADAAAAWVRLCAMAGLWALRGFGWWAIDRRDAGSFAGHVGFNAEQVGDEAELGWAVTAEAQGRGLAFEAAQAALSWGRAHGIPAPVSNIDSRNARSIRLAERLGARLEARTVFAPEAVALHYRHPGPEARG